MQQMFASSFKLSPRFLAHFKAFWNLPEHWELHEEELGIPITARTTTWTCLNCPMCAP